MAKVRKIFVRAGDLLNIHVIEGEDVPLNEKEWNYCRVHPFKFLLTTGKQSVTFHDPSLEIFVQQVGTKPRPLYARKEIE